MDIRCPECVKVGEKSSVYDEQGGATTLLYCPSFYDKEGEYHTHDINTTTYHYSCSRGHKWAASVKRYCPNINCNWPDEDVV